MIPIVSQGILSYSSRIPGPSWSWSYGSWIYNYLCNLCLSPLTLWVRIPLRRGVFDAKLCDKVCQWLAAGRWFSPDTTVSSTNKTDRHDINEILLKVALNTITLTSPRKKSCFKCCTCCDEVIRYFHARRVWRYPKG